MQEGAARNQLAWREVCGLECPGACGVGSCPPWEAGGSCCGYVWLVFVSVLRLFVQLHGCPGAGGCQVVVALPLLVVLLCALAARQRSGAMMWSIPFGAGCLPSTAALGGQQSVCAGGWASLTRHVVHLHGTPVQGFMGWRGQGQPAANSRVSAAKQMIGAGAELPSGAGKVCCTGTV